MEYKPREIKGNKAMLDAYKNVTASVQENSLKEDRLEKEDVNELLNLILPPEKNRKKSQ